MTTYYPPRALDVGTYPPVNVSSLRDPAVSGMPFGESLPGPNGVPVPVVNIPGEPTPGIPTGTPGGGYGSGGGSGGSNFNAAIPGGAGAYMGGVQQTVTVQTGQDSAQTVGGKDGGSTLVVAIIGAVAIIAAALIGKRG